MLGALFVFCVSVCVCSNRAQGVEREVKDADHTLRTLRAANGVGATWLPPSLLPGLEGETLLD